MKEFSVLLQQKYQVRQGGLNSKNRTKKVVQVQMFEYIQISEDV